MLNFLAGGGRTAQAIRDHDWSDSPLGEPAVWPPVLKTIVGTILASRFPQCIVWGADLITIPNDAFLPILGSKPAALGRRFSEVWAEVWNDIGPIAERAFAGEPTYIENFPLIVKRHGRPEEAFFTFCYSPIRDDRGTVVGMLDTVVETTSAVLARRQSELIAREMAHRIKNTLAVFQSIANQTLRGAVDSATAGERLQQRVAAMARAQDTLLHTNWSEALFGDVVQQALVPHLDAEAAISYAGGEVLISGQQALSLALALHELATNAVKYGALSQPGGKVDLSWDVDGTGPEALFRMEWHESGGPPVSVPDGKGFGSTLIARVLPADFHGEATLDYAPDGLRVALQTPLRNLAMAEPAFP